MKKLFVFLLTVVQAGAAFASCFSSAFQQTDGTFVVVKKNAASLVCKGSTAKTAKKRMQLDSCVLELRDQKSNHTFKTHADSLFCSKISKTPIRLTLTQACCTLGGVWLQCRDSSGEMLHGLDENTIACLTGSEYFIHDGKK